MWKAFLALCLALIFAGLGNIALSKGMRSVGSLEIYIFSNPWIIVGILLELAYFLSWLVVLSLADVSWGIPMHAIEYIFVAVLAQVLLGEEVLLSRWVGIGFIAIGVMFMMKSWNKKQISSLPLIVLLSFSICAPVFSKEKALIYEFDCKSNGESLRHSAGAGPNSAHWNVLNDLCCSTNIDPTCVGEAITTLWIGDKKIATKKQSVKDASKMFHVQLDVPYDAWYGTLRPKPKDPFDIQIGTFRMEEKLKCQPEQDVVRFDQDEFQANFAYGE